MIRPDFNPAAVDAIALRVEELARELVTEVYRLDAHLEVNATFEQATVTVKHGLDILKPTLQLVNRGVSQAMWLAQAAREEREA